MVKDRKFTSARVMFGRMICLLGAGMVLKRSEAPLKTAISTEIASGGVFQLAGAFGASSDNG